MIIFKDKSIIIVLERSCRDLSIDMVIHRGIFKNNQSPFLPLFHLTFIKGSVFVVEDAICPSLDISFFVFVKRLRIYPSLSLGKFWKRSASGIICNSTHELPSLFCSQVGIHSSLQEDFIRTRRGSSLKYVFHL